MLTHEENELLCRVEGDAPMGQLMRRHWVPALLSEQLVESDGAPVRVRLFGEDLVAFRDTDGRIGVLGGLLTPVTGLAGAAVAVYWLGLPPMLAGIVYLFGSLPPAVLNFLMAEYYRQEPDSMASIVLIGNLMSIGFVPFGLWLTLESLPA